MASTSSLKLRMGSNFPFYPVGIIQHDDKTCGCDLPLLTNCGWDKPLSSDVHLVGNIHHRHQHCGRALRLRNNCGWVLSLYSNCGWDVSMPSTLFLISMGRTTIAEGIYLCEKTEDWINLCRLSGWDPPPRSETLC